MISDAVPPSIDSKPSRITAIMGEIVTVPSRTFAAVGFVVWLAALTSACSSRSTPAGVPVPPPSTPAPQTPSPGAPPSEPPPSPAATAPGPGTTSLDCALIAEPGEPIATVALVDRIDPSNAPRPSNESEHLLFRQLYETLIRVDCKGRVRPGLAESWRLDADGRTWIVTLRENARFSDGTPVTSTDVRAGWMRDGAGDELLPTCEPSRPVGRPRRRSDGCDRVEEPTRGYATGARSYRPGHRQARSRFTLAARHTNRRGCTRTGRAGCRR